MDNCIFCKIINRELPSTVVYEDDKVMAFKDIHPEAPVHILIVPKKHIAGVMELQEADAEILAAVHMAAKAAAEKLGVSGTGFRLITNCGPDAGQTIFHLHYHLVGGKNMGAHIL